MKLLALVTLTLLATLVQKAELRPDDETPAPEASEAPAEGGETPAADAAAESPAEGGETPAADAASETPAGGGEASSDAAAAEASEGSTEPTAKGGDAPADNATTNAGDTTTAAGDATTAAGDATTAAGDATTAAGGDNKTENVEEARLTLGDEHTTPENVATDRYGNPVMTTELMNFTLPNGGLVKVYSELWKTYYTRPATKPGCLCVTRAPLSQLKLMGNIHFKKIKVVPPSYVTPITDEPSTLCPPCVCPICDK